MTLKAKADTAAKALKRFRGREADTEERFPAPQALTLWQIGALVGLRFEMPAGEADFIRWPAKDRAVLAASHDGKSLYFLADADPFSAELKRFAQAHKIVGIVYKAERDGERHQYYHVFDKGACQLEALPTPQGFGARYTLKGRYRMTQDGIVG